MKKEEVQKIRAFNRFYTKVLGLLDKSLLDSSFALAEVRVLFEIYHHRQITSRELSELLGMDKGYLSRMLLNFEKKQLIIRKDNEADGRVQQISLSQKGEKEFLAVNQSSNNHIRELLAGLSGREIEQLIKNMEQIQDILSKVNQ
jgi:DNA-binding MarR family transcriptional regulator